jgi:hypothetical protein
MQTLIFHTNTQPNPTNGICIGNNYFNTQKIYKNVNHEIKNPLMKQK